jgi:hypothetical protein
VDFIRCHIWICRSIIVSVSPQKMIISRHSFELVVFYKHVVPLQVIWNFVYRTTKTHNLRHVLNTDRSQLCLSEFLDQFYVFWKTSELHFTGNVMSYPLHIRKRPVQIQDRGFGIWIFKLQNPQLQLQVSLYLVFWLNQRNSCLSQLVFHLQHIFFPAIFSVLNDSVSFWNTNTKLQVSCSWHVTRSVTSLTILQNMQ